MTSLPVVGGRFGKYAVTGVLGHGGMGTVFAAEHAGTSRRVALKVLSPELALRPDFRRRFEREAATLARLYSPHIVDIYDHGEIDGCLFLVTQLVTGGDLGAWLERNGPMEPARAIDLMAQVGSALSDAHDAGVIHRDIKPSNVLLHQSTGELFAYLCDFGISQTGDQERTRTRGVLGTLAYTAPERHEGAEAAVASDIYSFGCLFFATLTGRAPYQGTDVQVAMAHLNDPVPTYSGQEPLAGQLNRILQRALAKDPEERYTTLDEMRADLLTAQRGDGVVSKDRSPRGRRLRRGAIVTVAAVAAVVVAVGAWLLPGGGGDPAEGFEGLCWNSVVANSKEDCDPPLGDRGLRWVFPSLDKNIDECGPREVSSREAVRSWWCPVPGGGGEGFTYTEWRSEKAAAEHYEHQYGRSPDAFDIEGTKVGREWQRSSPERGLYKMTLLPGDAPFTVSVYGGTTQELGRLCTRVEIRSPRTYETGAPECEP